MEDRYLIIADDFTGANDTGVQLRRRGFATEVLFSGKPVGTEHSVVNRGRYIRTTHMRSYPMR